MNTRRTISFLSIAVIFSASACVQPPAAIGPTAPAPAATSKAATQTLDADEVEPVSLSKPTAEAAAGIEGCGVTKWAEQLQGIGIVSHASLLPHYVPLAGGEPEIQSDEPTFVAYFNGTVRIAVRGAQGAPPYVDMQGATCAMIDDHPVWFQTGNTIDPEGNIQTPLPAKFWDKRLPAALP